MGPFIFLQGLVVIEVPLLSPFGDHFIKRRHGDINVAVVDQLRHEPVQEGEQKRVDMASVHVRIGHQDDLIIF